MWPKFLTTAAITTPTTHRSFSAQSCSKLSLCRSWKVSKQAGETGGRSKWCTGSGLLLPLLFPCFVCLLTICPSHSCYFIPLFFSFVDLCFYVTLFASAAIMWRRPIQRFPFTAVDSVTLGMIIQMHTYVCVHMHTVCTLAALCKGLKQVCKKML